MTNKKKAITIKWSTEDSRQPRLFIKVRTSFIGFHRYRGAAPSVAFLRSYHRHKFLVEALAEVKKANRDIEFFTLQKQISNYVNNKYANKRFEYSCETIALDILKTNSALVQVSVSEDGESDGIAMR